MTDESSAGDRRWSGVVMVLVVALIISVVGMQTLSVASDETAEYVERSEEWCDSRDGDLENSRVIGPHGGLHCKLPNGTSVHMSEVVGDERE